MTDEPTKTEPTPEIIAVEHPDPHIVGATDEADILPDADRDASGQADLPRKDRATEAQRNAAARAERQDAAADEADHADGPDDDTPVEGSPG